MKLDLPELPADQLVATVVLDSTRESETGEQAVMTRWQDLRRSLTKQGAGSRLLDTIEERVDVPTRVGRPHGRVIIATEGQIHLDRVLLAPPASDGAVLDRAPHAFALARVADCRVRYLVVEVDRAGADLTWVDSAVPVSEGHATHEEVRGDHDELAKAQAGGLSQRRVESRAEDSWERNAEQVAAEIDRVVAARRPDLVLLTGDVRAVSLVSGELGGAAREVTAKVEGGARAEGVNRGSFAAAVDGVLADFRLRRREQSLDRFRQEIGRDGSAVVGVEDVVDVLRKGQVAELVITEDVAGPPSSISGRLLWVGTHGTQIGVSRQEVVDLGVEEPVQLRADLALGRAALEQGAGITVADPASVHLVDGIGALLRWHDASTPAESLYSLSRDTASG